MLLDSISDNKKVSAKSSNAHSFLMSICGFENIQELTDIIKRGSSAVGDYKNGNFIRDPFTQLMEDQSITRMGLKHALSTRSLEVIEYFLNK